MSSTPNVVKNRLRFDFSKEQLAQDTEKLISSSRQTQDKVAALKEEERSFKSVVLPLAYDESEFSTLSSLLAFPSYVHPVKEIRDESAESNKKIEEFEIESSMREDVYNAVKTVYNKEFSGLKPEDQRIVSRIIRDFERNGLGLDKEKREKVKELKAKLSKLSIDFQKNLNEDKTELLFTEQQLEGLPKDFIENLKVDTNSGKRIVTLKYTDLFPVLKFCKVEDTRKQLEFANSAKCMQVNTPLLEQALQIRQEVAQMLGYKTHAHYVLDVRMAKNPENVHNFLNSLKDQLTEGGKKELQRLLNLKEEETKKAGVPFDGKINAWDFQFYHTLLKEREFEVNDNEIKDYFPADYTFGALLKIAQELFGLKFVKIENPEKELTWHEEVEYYQVFDEATNDYVGAFYLDLFPRDGKYGHAAAFPLQVHYVREDESASSVQRAISAMVCNFSKPTATKPSLLKHDEVVTLWHEFGHLCHGFATRSKYGRFSGTSVERDFVECPSQFMENFCWEVEGLKKISKHYVTGEPLPEETIKKMIAAKNLNVALLTLRQLFFGLFDMHCHLTSPTTEEKPLDTAQVWGKFREDVTLIPNTPGTNAAAGFGHIMGGYDVGYYGYLWSLVFSADIFVQFKTNGLFNSEIGKQYRKKILETGGMRDGIDMLKDFLGREPNNDAFLESIGLK